MDIINFEISKVDKMLLENYAKSNNKTISDVIRDSIEDIIENEIDLKLYEEAMKEFEKDGESYSFEEVLEELGIKKEEL